MTTVPNIISGTVTRRSSHQAPNWLKAIAVVVIGLVVIVSLSLALAPTPHTPASPGVKQAAQAQREAGSGYTCWSEVGAHGQVIDTLCSAK